MDKTRYRFQVPNFLSLLSQTPTHLHIVALGHAVQKFKGFELQTIICVLQAVNHHQLVLHCSSRVDLDNASECINADVTQVVAGALQKAGDALSSCEVRMSTEESGFGCGSV